MTETMSQEQLADLRARVLRKEQPSLEELRLAVHSIRVGYSAAATARSAKAAKKSAKAASGGKVDLEAIFGTGESNE
jgi:hypothetical protein